ncbi:MAG: hypothetical protein NTX79_06245 [Candidatus Micrarchaeota archaeon]|nr:hypothetical protein [Candidatus Micrarchaeota archaeon]
MKTSFRAQGASEYLVIVAVVVFIALVAIVLLSGAPGTASDAQVTQSQTYWGAVGPLAISEASAVPNGSGASIPYLKVRNKEAYPIKITALLGNNQSISTLQNGTLPSCYNIAPGGDTFIGSGSCSVTIGSGASSGTTLGGASSLCSGSSSYLVMNNFGFEYQTQGGITKRQYGQPLTIKCSGTAPQPSACANDSQSCADTTCCPGNTYFNGASLACNPAAICAVPPYGGMMGTAQSLNAGESSHWAIYCNCVDPAAFPNTRCLSASFDWGDGTAVTVVDNTIGHPAYTIGADHTYTAAGTYTITATATDVYGSTLAGTQAVTVTSACANDSQSCAGTTCCDGLELSCNPVQVCAMPPQSSGIFGPGSANASQESTWALQCVVGPGSANASQESTWALQCVVMDQYNSDTHCTASYQWGDGTVTNGVYTGSNYLSANHTYSASGTYDIFATGTDTMGSTVTKTKSVTVN